MKKAKLRVATVLSILVVVLFLICLPVQATETDIPKFDSIQEAAEYLREGMEQRTAFVQMNYQVTVDTSVLVNEVYVNELMTQIYDEALTHTGVPTEGDYIYKHIDAVTSNASWRTEEDVISITISYEMNYHSTAEQEAVMNAQFSKIMASLITPEMTDYQKVSAIYKYITENIVYDYENLEDDTHHKKYTAYAALIEKTCVCQGYANLFYRMSLAAGLDCRIITGYSNNESHAWNIVGIDGKYYNVDSTWDSESVQSGGIYQYFLKNETDFYNHSRDGEYSNAEFQAKYPISSSSYDQNSYWSGYTATDFSGGSGTKSAPYQISSPEELALMAWKINNGDTAAAVAHYQLTADIDLSAHEWVPVSGFSGVLDGQGHKISNMNVSVTNGIQYGFISFAIQATIKNLKLTNAAVSLLDTADRESIVDNFALLIGFANNSMIENCHVEGNIACSASNVHVGMLIGSAIGGTDIKDVFAEGTITATSNQSGGSVIAGGLVGCLDQAPMVVTSISKSFFVGALDIQADNHQDAYTSGTVAVGGLVGAVYWGETSITDCFAIAEADVHATQALSLGGAVGYINITENEDRMSLENVYASCVMRGDVQGSSGIHCGLFNGKANPDDNHTDPIPVGGYQKNCKVSIKNCGFFAHDKLYTYENTEGTGEIYLAPKEFLLSEHSISDLFIQKLAYPADKWTISDGFYPALVDKKQYAIPKTFDHEFKNASCIICGAVDKTAVEAGDWGSNLQWQLKGGVLTISGSGRMLSNGETGSDYPWQQYVFEELIVAEGIESISDSAFLNCKEIRNISLPDSLQQIEPFAFYGCISLRSIHIPRNTKLPDPYSEYPFTECTQLQIIDIDVQNPYYRDIDGILYSKDGKNLIAVPQAYTGEVTVTHGVTTIGEYAFNGCRHIVSVVIPNSVTAIGLEAFGNCFNLRDVYYEGSQEEWEAIRIDGENQALANTEIHYNAVVHFHNYVSVTVMPTCTAYGYMTYTCTCGDTYMGNKIEALGHNWKDATCDKPMICSRCKASSGRPAGHTYDNNVDGTCNGCGVHRENVETREVVHMFRMYNPNTGEHFYTGSTVERDNLIVAGWHYEGIGFTFPANTGDPVHRLFQPSTGEHLYTMDEAEKNRLMAQGWNYEGIAFNSAYDTEAVQHRLHNPNATVGAYHFTFSKEEKQNLIAAGWEYQGIGWYSCWK